MTFWLIVICFVNLVFLIYVKWFLDEICTFDHSAQGPSGGRGYVTYSHATRHKSTIKVAKRAFDWSPSWLKKWLSKGFNGVFFEKGFLFLQDFSFLHVDISSIYVFCKNIVAWKLLYENTTPLLRKVLIQLWNAIRGIRYSCCV
jgi:hypothetical protein